MTHEEKVKGMTPDEIDAYVLEITKGGFLIEWFCSTLYLHHGVDLSPYMPEMDTMASMEMDKLNQVYVHGWEDGSEGKPNGAKDCVLGKWRNYRKELRDKENEQTIK